MQYDKEIFKNTGIFVFNNAIPSQICRDTIAHFYGNPKKQFRGLTGSGYDPNIKNTIDWHINDREIDLPFHSILLEANNQIFKKYTHLKKFNLNYSGLQFQKNEKDKGFFRWHSDNDETNLNEARVLAPIIYLNTVEEGGHTEFLYQNIKIKPEEGKLVIFPSTWQYYHRGVPPKSNNKYIITCFGTVPRI